MNMPEIYVDPGNNATEKGIKTSGVSVKKKKAEFNPDVRVKHIPNIT